VLSDSAEEWIERVTEWRKLTKAEENGITANDEYFIYQTIIGAHPMPGKPLADFPQRLKEYLIKALREGKENSDWANPDEAYEKSAVAFALSLLKRDSRIQKSFLPFFKKVADYGIINSLAQVLLKFTCPGVPDLYQGCEPWDLSMVDPDNRRPVDYAERGKFLNNDDLDGRIYPGGVERSAER
jgi:maltooligosyltrehalose synthase